MKSKIVTIGLLVLSITACNRKRSKHPPLQDWDSNSQSYISTDDGQNYQQTSAGVPYWFYYYMLMRSNGTYGYHPGADYYSYNRSVNYHSASRGIKSSYGGHAFKSSSRGGFGWSGRSVSA